METTLKPFKIYKSSAGSGKTYTLVLSYLTIILKDPDLDKFKKILAITFTNKASKEMKERILKGLDTLIKGEDTNFIQAYEKATGKNSEELKLKSKALFTRILHNYGQLNIQTIDKFVHKLIRSFSRELGLSTNFELETNVDDFVQRCIDELLESVGEDDQLTNTLIAYTKNLVDDQQFQNIEYALENQSKLLKSEEGGLALEVYKDMTLKDFEVIQKDLNAKKKEQQSTLKNQAKKILALMQGHDLSLLKIGRTTPFAKTIDNIIKGEKKINYSEAQIKNAKDEKWYAKAVEKSHPELDSFVKANSAKLSKELLTLFELIKASNLLQEVDKRLVSFSLLNSIRQILKKVKKDNNIVFISDFNEIISEVIKNEPTPYIYEKMGNRFSHYFIDEFQDTSVLQWNNLIPLVHDSLSTENENLIVGDAKQSIYRWRGGDASQFINLPEVKGEIADIQFINNAFARSADIKTLDDNYRSSESVIDFNNWLFDRLIEEYQSFPMLQNIYKDVRQNKKRKEIGYVKVNTFSELNSRSKEVHTEEEELANDPFELMYNDILECIDDNFNYGDICILLRSNGQGTKVANFLKEKGIEVTSQDSLLLAESQPVLAVVNLLTALNLPNDENIIKVFYSNHKNESILSLFLKYRIPNEKNSFYNSGLDLNSYIADMLPGFDMIYYNELSILDKVDYLIPLLGFSRKSIFMDKLLNFTFDFQQKYGHNVNFFIEHFEAKKNKISVTPPESSQAINIMTIHKSKGLQFPVVLIPLPLDPKKSDDIWIQDDTLKSLGLENFALSLKDDILTEGLMDRKKEIEELKNLDNANLLYVALTRAEDRLYINLKKTPKSTKVFKYPNHLEHIISDHPSFDNENNRLIIGERAKRIQKEEKTTIVIKNNVETYSNWRETLELSISPKAQQEDYDKFLEFEWGKVIHEILQTVNELNELTTSFNKFMAKNTNWQTEKDTLQSIFKRFRENEEVQTIFSTPVEVLSERALINKHGEELRPDKIIIKNDNILLIDFKTGTPKKTHVKQIQSYQASLQDIFNKPIEMYLIYLSPDKTIVQHV